MLEDCRLGVIGTGNMGGGLIIGLLRGGRIRPEQITATDLRDEVLEPLRQSGVETSAETLAAVGGKDLVVVAVKPQLAAEMLAAIGPRLETQQLLISIMAGVSTHAIEAQLDGPVPVVRVMPQMLAKVGAAATAVCGGSHATDEHVALARALFDEVGSTVAVAESQMNAVTGLSGSGPAYVYTVIEALVDGGVNVGLPRDTAMTLAAQTAMGAARMVLESGLHPAVLRDQITSPGGTTIAGLHKLEEKGLRDALISAIQAATGRADELGGS